MQLATRPYSDGATISRWGDYSSAVVDPTHPAFLVSNEYALTRRTGVQKLLILWLA